MDTKKKHHDPIFINHLFLDDEAEKNLRRISYLQATKEAPMEVEEK